MKNFVLSGIGLTLLKRTYLISYFLESL